jgi:formylglycine-generating enzyme required for sulfatase activity
MMNAERGMMSDGDVMPRIVRVWIIVGLTLLMGTASTFAEKRGVKIEGKVPAAYVAAQTGKSWAVAIGVNRYKDKPAIPELRYAVADAKAVGEELKRRGYSVMTLLDEEATRDRILEVLGDELPHKLKPEDRLVIFYAGHGETKSVGGQTMGYLLPVDAKRNRLHKTAVNMGEIRQLSGFLPAKHVLYLVDVCYGGIAGQQTRSLPAQTESYLKQITREKGRQLITAGGPGQQVVEGPQWGHSVFTYYLLEGLSKGLADLNQDGVIPASELYAYLDGRVPTAAENQQRPELWSLAPEKGEFVFLTSMQEKPIAPASRPQIGGASTEEMAAMKKRLEEMERKLMEQSEAARPPKPIEEARARPYEAPRQTSREITGKDGAPMALVPAGEFLYGHNNQMSLPAFYMDKYEVTTVQYAKFMAATSRLEPRYWQTSVPVSNGQKPVVGVTWHNADAYCRYYGKRLPTKQEWEKAARGTDGRKYPWGNDEPNSGYANYGQSYDDNFYSTRLTAVGKYEAGKSPYGIYDLAGNVWEWTSSDYDSQRKVFRGGSWDSSAVTLEATYGGGAVSPDDGLFYLGFRCVQDGPK